MTRPNVPLLAIAAVAALACKDKPAPGEPAPGLPADTSEDTDMPPGMPAPQSVGDEGMRELPRPAERARR